MVDPTSNTFSTSQFAEKAFDSKQFKASIHHKVAEIKRIAFSAILELCISLVIGIGGVLSFTAAPVFIPYFIATVGITSSVVIIFRIYLRAKSNHPTQNIPKPENQLPFKGDHKALIDELSAVLAKKPLFQSDTLSDEDSTEEMFQKIKETFDRQKKNQNEAKIKFDNYLSTCSSKIKGILNHGQPAVVDDAISELSQQSNWSKIFSLFAKATSFGFSFTPKTDTIPRRLLSNSRDLLGYQKTVLGWADIGFRLHRCHLREQEIVMLERQLRIIKELTSKSDPDLQNYFNNHLHPLEHHLTRLYAENHKKKFKQTRSIIESTVGTAETVTDLVSHFFNNSEHTTFLKATQGTLAGLSGVGSAISIGFQGHKMSAIAQQRKKISTELKSLHTWKEKHKAFLMDNLPPSNSPLWDEWKNSYQHTVSQEEYVISIRTLNNIITAKIDVLKKELSNNKKSFLSKLLKFALTLLKFAIVIKDIVVIFGKMLGPGARLAFFILNLVFSICSLVYQLGKFGYKAYANRHAIDYYKNVMNLFSRYQAHQKKLLAKRALLKGLEEEHERFLKAAPEEKNKPGRMDQTSQIATAHIELQQLNREEMKFAEDYNILYNKHKKNLLRDHFHSYTDKDLENLFNEVGTWLFDPTDRPYCMIHAEMKKFGLVTNSLGRKEITKYLKGKY